MAETKAVSSVQYVVNNLGGSRYWKPETTLEVVAGKVVLYRKRLPLTIMFCNENNALHVSNVNHTLHLCNVCIIQTALNNTQTW